jgi:hypothetical protein
VKDDQKTGDQNLDNSLKDKDLNLEKTDNAKDRVNESNIQTENVVQIQTNTVDNKDTNDEEVKETTNDESVTEKINEQAINVARINKNLRVYNDETNINNTDREEEKILLSLEEAENNLKIAKAIKSHKLTKAK